MVALHFPSLQDKAENADYVIGAVLFLIATLLLFAVINRLRDPAKEDASAASSIQERGGFQGEISHTGYARLAAMGAVVLLGCAGLARASMVTHSLSMAATYTEAQRFPQHVGNYTLVRTWKEAQLAGPVIYVWGQYAPAGGGAPIAVGVSPTLGLHDPLMCHFIRGENPLWQGQLTLPMAGGDAVDLSSGFYNDGVTQLLEASTQCGGSSCGEFATDRTHFGFIYTRLRGSSLLSADPEQVIPVLLKVETLDLTLPADTARQQLTMELRDFLGSVRLDELTRPDRM
jgi:exosortase J